MNRPTGQDIHGHVPSATLAKFDLRHSGKENCLMTEIGCIADDYTGGTDVAAGLRRAGLRVALVFGVPDLGPGACPPAMRQSWP